MSSRLYYNSHVGTKHDTLNGIIYYLHAFKERYNNSVKEQEELKEKIASLRIEIDTKLETPNKDMESIISLKNKYDDTLKKYNETDYKLKDHTYIFLLDLCKLFID